MHKKEIIIVSRIIMFCIDIDPTHSKRWRSQEIVIYLSLKSLLQIVGKLEAVALLVFRFESKHFCQFLIC